MTDDYPDRERSRSDFIAEAEGLLEGLTDDLRELEAAFAAGSPHHALIDTIFRQVHSLKGFAGLLGFPQFASLSHALEDLLSRLRLGGRLDGGVIDLLHDTHDALLVSLRDLRSGATAPPALEALRDRLIRAATSIVSERTGSEAIDIPQRIGASLTEQEESRLRACGARGCRLSLVRIHPRLDSLEEHLQEMARRIGAIGELISTIPVIGEEGGAGILFDLLVATSRPLLASDLPDIVSSIRPVGTSGPEPAAVRSPEAREALDAIGSPSFSLRVPVRRLDDVLSHAGDLSTAIASMERGVKSLLDRHPDDRLARELGPRMLAVSNRLRALQRSAIDARLVPLEEVFRKVGRMVARAARITRKEVDLHTLGADTELDKSVMDGLTSPLMHLVANALDHGIEAPEEREQASKPRRGRVVLSAFRKGPSVVIDVIDDGRGIGVAAVQAAAQARGLVPSGEERTLEEIHEMIFRPGFSTAATVSEVSGRGVGMDVVRRSIRELKGTITVRSVEGQGTTFSVTVPTSLSLVPSIIVQSSGQRFAIPLASIRENIRIDDARVRTADGGEVFERPQGPLPLISLERLMRTTLAVGEVPATVKSRYALVTGEEGRAVGIVVDGFVGRREGVVKPVGRRVRDLPGVAGAADIGEATAVLVLDPEALIAGGPDARVVS